MLRINSILLKEENCKLCYHVYYEEYLAIYHIYNIIKNDKTQKEVYSLIYLNERLLDGEDEEPMRVLKVGSLEECLKALRHDSQFIQAIEDEMFECNCDNLKEEEMKMFLEEGL